MPQITTIAIVSCILGFPSSDAGDQPALLAKSKHVEAHAHPSNDVCASHQAVIGHAPFGRPRSTPGFVTRIQDDERFWAVYRDYDPDADTMLGWKQFQELMTRQD